MYTPLIMELIKEDSLKRIKYVKDHQKNKLIMASSSNDFMTLSKGTYVIHIFNRSSQIKNLNLMIYASERVDIHLRKESSFYDLKEQAIFNHYK